jgi:Photosynthesis system II assembly factor YCF48
MFRGKTIHLALALIFYSSLNAFGQWSAAISGTTNNLNGAHLLDSGVGFVVGDAGTILKTTDAGMTWSPVTSGTTNALHDVYFFDATQGVVVGDQGLILRTTDGGTGWQGVASGVMDGLRAVSFSGVNGISAGDSQTFSIQPIQDLRGRSVKADFSDPRCSDPETSSNSSSATYSALKDRS